MVIIEWTDPCNTEDIFEELDLESATWTPLIEATNYAEALQLFIDEVNERDAIGEIFRVREE